MIKKFYADVQGGQTHYRRTGEGNPLVLLHASPMSSELMQPLMQSLSGLADVVAPDTPGYGQSDSLPIDILKATDDLSPYVHWLSAFLDSLNLEKVALYGTATGAQIAIEFARAFPDRLEYVVLDNAAHFTNQERTDIMDGYFPSIAPEADGGHLQKVWDMARGVFQWFPWYAQDDNHRVSNEEPPVGMVHATALAYLAAGSDYAQAYQRAFRNEDANRVVEITVPVRIIRWQGSVIKRYSDGFDQFEWPEHIQMMHCGNSVAERYESIANVVKDFQ